MTRITLSNGAAAFLRHGDKYHYLTTLDNERVIVGVAENDDGKCRMVWSAIEDFDAEV